MPALRMRHLTAQGSARLGIEVNPVVRTAKQWADPRDALVAQIEEPAHVTVLDSRRLVIH